jgi:hypothetical protein
MELALLVVIAAVLGGGVSGALLTTWNVHRRLRSLEYHLIDLERITIRETKRRAAGQRWDKNEDQDKELLKLMATAEPKKNYDNEW